MIVSAPSPPAFFHNVLDLVRRVTRVAKTVRRLNEKEKEALQTKGVLKSLGHEMKLFRTIPEK